MYQQQVEQKLKQLNIQFSVRGQEVQCKCLNPKHKDSNPSFSINTTSGLYNCFACGFKGHIQNLWEDIEVDEEDLRTSHYSELLDSWEVHVSQPKDFLEELLPPVDHLVDYDVRGISGKLMKDLGVYYCSVGRYRGRLIFPVRDSRGKLLSFDARIYQPPDREPIEPMVPEAKYLRPTSVSTKSLLYPIDYVSEHFSEPYVILTEGVFDAISYIQMGYPAVCNFGLGAPDLNKVGLLASLGVTEIVNGLDGDQAGTLAWQGSPELNKKGLKDAWRPFVKIKPPLGIIKEVREHSKDANDYLQLYFQGD